MKISQLKLVLLFFLFAIANSSCKQDVSFVNLEEQLRNDPLLEKYLEASFREVHLLNNAVDISAYNGAKTDEEKKSYVKSVRNNAADGALTYKQARKNTFYYTSKLYSKYVLKGKMSKTTYLAITKEKRIQYRNEIKKNNKAS